MYRQDPCTRCGGELEPVEVLDDENNSGDYVCTQCGQKFVIEPLFKGTFAEFHWRRLQKERQN